MKHHIIVKWKKDIVTPDYGAIKAIFDETLKIQGVKNVALLPNIIKRENRYDLMIVIDMDEDALSVYDECDAHKRWKKEYGEMIDKKAIFDCE